MTIYVDPKNVNTNLLSNGKFVEQQNALSSPGPVGFVAIMAYQPSEKHISYDADSTTARPGGGLWPVVTVLNSKFRNPPGDGSGYDHISVPNA